jgi:hypothetical protein
VADVVTRKFSEADSREEITLGLVEIIRLGSITVGRETLDPGWRWSTHTKPIVGTELCEYHHVGIQISGRDVHGEGLVRAEGDHGCADALHPDPPAELSIQPVG